MFLFLFISILNRENPMFLTYLAYGVVLAIYGAFAWVGKADPGTYVTVLTGALSALGTHHVVTSAAKRATDAANVANPVPPQNPIVVPTSVTRSQ